MTVDTDTFAAITGRVDELQREVETLAALISTYGLERERRVDAMFGTLEAMCEKAGVWELRPSRQLLRLVRPGEDGGAS